MWRRQSDVTKKWFLNWVLLLSYYAIWKALEPELKMTLLQIIGESNCLPAYPMVSTHPSTSKQYECNHLH